MHKGRRSFPGRLTLDQWLRLPYTLRVPLIWRAQSDLIGSFRFCGKKRCRRERRCCGDTPEACRQRLWRLKSVRPKTLRREWARLHGLEAL
jgi:hypothetical protein